MLFFIARNVLLLLIYQYDQTFFLLYVPEFLFVVPFSLKLAQIIYLTLNTNTFNVIYLVLQITIFCVVTPLWFQEIFTV